MFVTHEFPAAYQADAEILILGTIPSPKSRAAAFYYAHPQNRFWRVLYAVYGEPFAETTEKRLSFLYRHKIALWDVLASCEIDGAADTSISSPVPNDISALLSETHVHRIYTTGKKAQALYEKYCLPHTGVPAVCLPSPSPANCAVSFDALVAAYRVLREKMPISPANS